MHLRPTFNQHASSVVLDWKWVERASDDTIAQVAAWLSNRRIDAIVDFASGINLYPDLRLCNNSASEYSASMARIEAILQRMPWKNAVIGFHNNPENYYSDCSGDFRASLLALDAAAERRNVTLHLRVGAQKPPSSIEEAARYMQGTNHVSLGLSLAFLVDQGIDTASKLESSLSRIVPSNDCVCEHLVCCCAIVRPRCAFQAAVHNSQVVWRRSRCDASAHRRGKLASSLSSSRIVVDARVDETTSIAATVDAEFREILALETSAACDVLI